MSKRKYCKPSKYCHLCGPTERVVFSFPKRNPDRMKEWLEFCNLTELDVLRVPYLCDEHFDDKFIFKKQQKTVLHVNAVPTIIIEHSVNSLDTEEPSTKKRARNCYLCGPTVVHLHQFPKDNVPRSEWFKALNMAVDERTDLKLCSKHFSDDSLLITSNGKIKLKCNARPEKMVQSTSKELMNTDSATVLKTSTPLNPVSLKKVREALQELASTSKSDETGLAKIAQADQETGVSAFADNNPVVFLDVSDVCDTPVEENASINAGTEERTSESNPNDVCVYNSTPKRTVTNISSKPSIRYLGDINTPSLESPRSRRKCLSVIRTHKLAMGEKMRKLKRQNSRLKSKMSNLKSLLSDLKQKNLITEEAETTLLGKAPPAVRRIISRRLKGRTSPYSKEIMAFALTLQFYSTRAYKYVRKTFENLLPSLSTLKKRRQRVDARPGFIKEAFNHLAKMTQENDMAINLCIDEMSIRQHIDSRGDREYGYCDLGTFIEEEGEKVPARNCLLFLAVNLRQNFRIPVAYFLVNSLSGSERANLLRLCIISLHEIKVHVRSVTFDGAAVNIAMCQKLGANFDYNLKQFDPTFKHPSSLKKIYIFFDPCHMEKLLRNRFGLARRKAGEKCNYIRDSENRRISFEEIEYIVKKQEKEGLHAGNKLTQKHIDFHKKIMNVLLSVQVLSKSTSDTLKFLQTLGEIPATSGTAHFCSTVNDIFDTFNCRSKYINKFKKPKMRVIDHSSLQEIKDDCVKWIKYLEELKDENCDTPCYRSTRKTGFLGFIVSLINITSLFEDLSNDYHQEYLLSYRILQDYIENFFGSLRARGGFNDNPSALQLEIAIKYLLIHTEIRSSENGNCEWVDLEDVHTLAPNSCPIPSTVESLPLFQKIEIDEDELEIMEGEEDNPTDKTSEIKFSVFQQEVIKYISGFSVRKIVRHFACNDCKTKLIDTEYENDCALLKIKNRGYLTIPSFAASQLGFICERAFRTHINLLGSNSFLPAVKNYVLKENNQYNVLILSQNHHEYVLNIFITMYFNIRKHYENKKLNKNTGSRNVRKRITIFQHE